MVYENHIFESIINLMIYESNLEVVTSLFIKDYNIIFLVIACIEHGYTMKVIMRILSDNKIDFDKKIHMLKYMCEIKEKVPVKKLVK